MSPRTGAGLRAAEPSKAEAEDNRYTLPQGDRVPLPKDRSELTPAPNALVVLRLFKPGMGRFPAHVHLDFAERFVVRKGVAIAEVDGDTVRLTAEDGKSTLYVPAGLPHVNPYNYDSDDLLLEQSFAPATEAARSYVETLAAVLWDGRDHEGELPWEVALAVGDATDGRTYITPGRWRTNRDRGWSFTLQRRLALPIGRLVAGTRDFYVHLAPEERASNGLKKQEQERVAKPELRQHELRPEHDQVRDAARKSGEGGSGQRSRRTTPRPDEDVET